MTTLNLQVGTSADDARVRDAGPSDGTFDSISTSTTAHTVGQHAADHAYGVGMRFQSVAIGQGDTITTAVLTFTVRSASSLTTVLTNIDGEDVDDAATFSTIGDYTGRTRTSAVVAWDSIAGWGTVDEEKASPELKTIAQEIVDQYYVLVEKQTLGGKTLNVDEIAILGDIIDCKVTVKPQMYTRVVLSESKFDAALGVDGDNVMVNSCVFSNHEVAINAPAKPIKKGAK